MSDPSATPATPGNLNADDILNFGREVLAIEAAALKTVEGRVGEGFTQAVMALLTCRGSVIVVGVGKPWFIAQKISATMASTGTRSFPLHPSDALHGDVGRVRAEDVVLALSNSGESEEVVRLLPVVKRFGATLIAITGRPESPLGKAADIIVNIGRIDEACPLKLAPSASSTALLAVGDALALTVQKARGFSREDYARFHPAGALGRKLMRVAEVMRPVDQTATVLPTDPVKAVLDEITTKRTGCACVIDAAGGHLLGIYTDGDLRRQVGQNPAVLTDTVQAVMTANPRTILPDALVGTALRICREYRIDEVPVVDETGVLQGLLDVQDLLDVGLGLT